MGLIFILDDIALTLQVRLRQLDGNIYFEFCVGGVATLSGFT